MSALKIIPIELIDHPNPKHFEEKKISSSTNRIRLLGTVIKPILPNNIIPKTPYIIGLTGRKLLTICRQKLSLLFYILCI